MMTSPIMAGTNLSDSQLVLASRAGDQQAFRQIVERHQNLICSLAYCATGSLNKSEDLAQETFVAAWKHLPQLREPAKLRPWLCGITRFVIGTELRRQMREPVHGAESLAAAEAETAAEQPPYERAISREEEAILWRTVAAIPETYREPLVLFYREHQSIKEVAEQLSLSEDAVKQRLVRGRRLLHEQMLAFVEGALAKTHPGPSFTLGVMAALPAWVPAAGIPAAGTAATAGATSKATGWAAIAKAALGFAPSVILGVLVGLKMGEDTFQSPHRRDAVARFWRILVLGLACCIILPLVALFLAVVSGVVSANMRPQILEMLTLWLGALYAIVVVAAGIWLWQRVRVNRSKIGDGIAHSGETRPFSRWIVVATLATGLVFVALLFDTNWKVKRLAVTEAQALIGARPDTQIAVSEYQNGDRILDVRLKENGQVLKFTAPADDTMLAWLGQREIKYPTYVQGRDFEVLGWPGRLLPMLSLFVLTAGMVVLWRSRRRHRELWST